jgi:hypothetical protein
MMINTKQMVGAGICFLVAVSCIYLFRNTWRYDRWVRSWPTARGTVINCSIIEIITGNTGGATRSRSLRPGFTVAARYSYQVGRVRYEGKSISNNPPEQVVWSLPGKPNQELIALRDRFSEGSQVDVHYNPGGPDQSYLYYRHPADALWFMGIVGAFFGLLGVVLLCLSITFK